MWCVAYYYVGIFILCCSFFLGRALNHPHTYHAATVCVLFLNLELAGTWNTGVYGRGPPALYTSAYLLQIGRAIGDDRVRTFLGFLGFSVDKIQSKRGKEGLTHDEVDTRVAPE